jgi:hypothetical protein
LGPDADVQGGYWLVGHDEFGTHCQRPGDANALPLSAAEFVWKTPQYGFVEAHRAQQFDNPSANPIPPISLPMSMNDQGLGNNGLYGKARIERSERILKDDLHIAPQPAHLPAAGAEQVAAFESNAAARRLNQPQDEAPERTFSRAGFAHQSESFSLVNVERDIVDRTNVVTASRLSPERRRALRINFGEISDFDQRHHLYLYL